MQITQLEIFEVDASKRQSMVDVGFLNMLQPAELNFSEFPTNK